MENQANNILKGGYGVIEKMRCQFCGGSFKLERYIHLDFENGKYIHERFMYNCDKCQVAISPKLILMTAQPDTERELQIFRQLFFEGKEKEVINAPKEELKNAT